MGSVSLCYMPDKLPETHGKSFLSTGEWSYFNYSKRNLEQGLTTLQPDEDPCVDLRSFVMVVRRDLTAEEKNASRQNQGGVIEVRLDLYAKKNIIARNERGHRAERMGWKLLGSLGPTKLRDAFEFFVAFADLDSEPFRGGYRSGSHLRTHAVRVVRE